MSNLYSEKWRHQWPYAVAILFGVALFIHKFGLKVLDFNHYNWLMTYGDCPTEYISWQFYRQTPWHFPVIGTMQGYDYPTVTGVGLTGAIPLLAIPFKILSPILSPDFQYFGYWFLACYVLQGYFSVRLLGGVLGRYAPHTSSVVLAVSALFLVASPALMWRTGHMNLCAHWLILWSLSVYFEAKTPQKVFKAYWQIVVVTALVHQYLLLMQFGLAFAAFACLWQQKAINWRQFTLFNLANIVSAALIWYVIGNFNAPLDTMSIAGFGVYSANLNTFFDSHGEAAFLPSLSHGEGQFEGFAYLGLGFLLILVLTAAHRLFKPRLSAPMPSHSTMPLWCMAAFLAVYALSTHIFLGKISLLKADFLLDIAVFKYVASAFRSSGRFIWPLYYLVLAWGLGQFARLALTAYWKKIVVLGLFLIQIIDVYPYIQRERSHPEYMQASAYAPEKPHFEHWLALTKEAKMLVTLPPYDWSIQTYGDYLVFAKIASLNHQSITTGYLARRDGRAQARFMQILDSVCASGQLTPATQSAIFIAGRRSMRSLKNLAQTGAIRVFEYQDYLIGVPTPFKKTLDYLTQLPGCQPFEIKMVDVSAFIDRYAEETIIVAAKDEASHGLCPSFKEKMTLLGSQSLANLGFREPYLAIIHQNKYVFEAKAPARDSVVRQIRPQDKLGIWQSPVALSLLSGGAEGPNRAQLRVGQTEHSLNKRGLNFIVINAQGRVIARAYFDTFLNCEEGEIIEIKN